MNLMEVKGMYNFDELLQRKQTNCTKWDALERDFGRDDLMPFWVADADFPILPDISEVIRERANDKTTYGYTFAGSNYFDSIISWNRERHGLELLKNEIIPAPGVVTALALILLGLTDVRDKVLINPPVYSPFFDVVKGLDRELVEVSLLEENQNYYFDFEKIEEKLALGVKVYIICNPHNPVGRVWKRAELQEISELCNKYNVILVSDEIHYDIVFSGHQQTPILNIDSNAIMITAPSKTFNIAGLKSSVILAKNEEHKHKIGHWVANMHLYLNLFAYDTTEIAYTKGAIWVDEMIAYLEENAKFVLDFLAQNMSTVKAYMPESTYLMWLDFSGYGLTGQEINHCLIDDAKVALNAGSEYGERYQQFVRLNIATPRYYLKDGLNRIAKAFESKF